MTPVRNPRLSLVPTVAVLLATAVPPAGPMVTRAHGESDPELTTSEWGQSQRIMADCLDVLLSDPQDPVGANPPAAGDAVFLRRIYLDLTGRLPSPEEVQRFAADPAPDKRNVVVDDLLDTKAFAQNWARYWRDVILYRATDQRARIGAPALERWLTEQFETNVGWDRIATELVTATGDVRENGNTFLILAQMARAAELAAETSRIFLGIQLQCAQCHDHPEEQWKREQFHELAAFFARVRLRRRQGNPQGFFAYPQRLLNQFDADQNGKLAVPEVPQPQRQTMRRLLAQFDANRDEHFSLQELQQVRQRVAGRATFEVVAQDQARARRFALFQNPDRALKRLDADEDGSLAVSEVPQAQRNLMQRLLRQFDRNQDDKLSAQELREVARRVGRGDAGPEHLMPNLQHPQQRGTLTHPVFFVSNQSPGQRKTDRQRREALAAYLTSPENEWFARAFVNRCWTSLMGWGFYELVDDLGPGRDVEQADVLDALAGAFRDHDYDIKWLMGTIVRTAAYQAKSPASHASDEPPTAAACPTKLRADQLYDSLEAALGRFQPQQPARRPQQQARRRYAGGPRQQVQQLFGYDPSTPADELADSIPQALFLMNSPLLHRRILARGNTTLGTLLRQSETDEQALKELYLTVLAREPSAAELRRCLDYLGEVDRWREGFEDILWCLLNSTEFRMSR